MQTRRGRARVWRVGAGALLGCACGSAPPPVVDAGWGGSIEPSSTLAPLLEVHEACAVRGPTSELAVELHVSPYGDDTLDGSSLEQAVLSLEAAEALVPDAPTSDYEIIVHDGSDQPELGGWRDYRYQQTGWSKYSSEHRTLIRAAAGQKPVFDGREPSENGASKSFGFHVENPGVETNLTVSGLTFRNYGQVGIWVYGSCNRIYDNETYDIGDLGHACVWLDEPPSGDPLEVFDRPECTTGWTSGSLPRGCECVGYSGILVMHGDRNLIQHNDVIDGLNVHARDPHMHSIYLANGASDNLVEDNYIRNVGGSPIKFSSGSNRTPVLGNLARRNYLDRAGDGIFFHDDPKSGGPSSPGNVLDRNVATFPSFTRSSDLAVPQESFVYLHEQQSSRYFQGNVLGSRPELVAGSVVADVGQKGAEAEGSRAEVFVGLNYPELGFSKLVYKDAGAHSTELRSVAFSSHEWQITALAAGQFGHAEPWQVVMALRCVAEAVGCTGGRSRTRIMVGHVVDGVYTFDEGLVLYDETGPDAWEVSAMTAGAFAGGDRDQLLIAARVRGVQHIFVSDGATVAAPLYSSDKWSITAMTSGRLLGDAPSLVTAFQRNTEAGGTSVYEGDGSTGATSRVIWQTDAQSVVGLAIGAFGDGEPRLAMVVSDDTARSIYVSERGIENPLWRQLYTTPSWNISSLAAGDVDDDSTTDELLVGFDIDEPERPYLTRVTWGDGLTPLEGDDRATGATNGGEYYRSALEYPH